MARQSQGSDGWPTILWIAWREGETEHHEPLCYAHRDYVFEHYPASADGQGRRGESVQHVSCAATPNRPAPQPTRFHNSVGCPRGSKLRR